MGITNISAIGVEIIGLLICLVAHGFCIEIATLALTSENRPARMCLYQKLWRELGPVDEVPSRKLGRGNEHEANVALGSHVVSGGQSASVFKL